MSSIQLIMEAQLIFYQLKKKEAKKVSPLILDRVCSDSNPPRQINWQRLRRVCTDSNLPSQINWQRLWWGIVRDW